VRRWSRSLSRFSRHEGDVFDEFMKKKKRNVKEVLKNEERRKEKDD
jgi:hypothetical protein